MCSDQTLKEVRTKLLTGIRPSDRLRAQPSSAVAIDDLLSVHDDIQFLRDAYQFILGRATDYPDMLHWRERLTSGEISRENLIVELQRSREGQKKNVRLFVNADQRPKGRSRFQERIRRYVLFPFSTCKALWNLASISQRLDRLEQHVNTLASQGIKIAERIECDLDACVETSDRDTNRQVVALQALVSQRLQEATSRELEQAIVSLGREMDTMHESQHKQNWLIVGESSQQILKGCQTANIQVDPVPASRGLSEPAVLNPESVPKRDSTLNVLANSLDNSRGGIVVNLAIHEMEDEQLIQLLSLSYKALAEGGYVVVGCMVGNHWHNMRLESALRVCGFDCHASGTSRQESESDSSEVIVGRKLITQESRRAS